MSITEQVDVAIVGSGPAGLAAAIELRRQGVARVCVLERDGEAGGIPRHCAHPPFGLREHGRLLTGPAYALRNVEQAERAGVDIRLRHSVVALAAAGLLQLATPEGPRSLRATRVLLATGARETPRSARLLGGDRPLGVINTGALQAYLYLQGLKPFERPLIVGTELVSLSAVMSCRRAGIRPVAMLERNARATARWPLSLFPRLCGVPMHFSSELLEIEGRGRVEAARVRLGDGRVERIACDGILLSGRFVPESSLVRLSHLELDPASGGRASISSAAAPTPPISPPATCSGRSRPPAGRSARTKDRRPAGRRPAGRTAGRRARYRHRLQRSAQAVRAAAAAGRSDTRPGASTATRKRGRQRTPADTGRWSPGVGTHPVLPAGAPPAGAAGRPAPTAGHPAPGSRLPHLRPLNPRREPTMRIAALDQGTTSTRVLVASQDGSADIQLALRHQQHHPQSGWVEHDPLELLANLQRCLEASGRVDAIGLANQGESCMAWDARSGEPLSPLIVWQDNRTTPHIERLRASGAEALVLERSGLPLDAYFSASKLGWIVEHLPAARRALEAGRLRLGTSDAWFLDRLCGTFATDVTTASRTALMNLAEGRWDPELCALFGVPIECLPEIRDTVGHFGVIGNTPLTASVVDQQASLYGHGCRQPGDAKITFGTGAFALTLSGERIIRSPETGLLATIAWQIDGKPVYAMDGGVYDASAAVEWAGRLGLFSDFSELAGFDRPPAIDRGLAFVPALSGLACPHWDRSAGAMWLGMDAGTRREDLCQALLEGVVLRSAEVIQAMDGYLKVTDRLSIDGGLARSPYFAQFLADSLQRRIVTQRFDELTAFGCAALAARGLGYELAEPRNTRTEFQPRVDAGTARRWQVRFSEAVARTRGWR